MRNKVTGRSGPPPLPDDEISLFRQAVRDVRPLPAKARVLPNPERPRPIPRQTLKDQEQVLQDSLSDHIPWELVESGEELSFLRPGMSQQTLRRLRRGHWVIQSELDLHGMVTDEARASLAIFLNECRSLGLRCVRIIHGKGLGSRNREPVLKKKVANWLMQRDEVLAFCQARQVDGSGGAVIVLLKSG
jgi:DNA-nicking Smr family endonuclease